MNETLESRLEALGLRLPAAAAPAANYVPTAIYGKTLVTSGQLPMENGRVAVSGKLGDTVGLEDGQRAARHCALNVLAQANRAVDGDFSKIARLVKLTVFVASTPAFTEQHKVANGTSDLMVEVLGDSGRHARSAVGVVALPFDAAVEVEAIFELV